MGSMFGIYRMSYGAKIVQSTFDYETSTIGSFKLPIQFDYLQEYCNGDVFHRYKYYQAMLEDEQALAVFNVNNYCLCVVRRDMAYETDLDPDTKLDLLQWRFNVPLPVPVFEHVGYVKSFAECLAVTQPPTYLIRSANATKAYDFEDDFEGTPLINPPLSLYKTLVNSEARAVYFDTISQQPKFLFK